MFQFSDMSYLVNSQQLPLVRSKAPTRSAKSVRETNQREVKWSEMSREKSIREKRAYLLKWMKTLADIWATFFSFK
jgi:PAB1-binding protein PBP1